MKNDLSIISIAFSMDYEENGCLNTDKPHYNNIISGILQILGDDALFHKKENINIFTAVATHNACKGYMQSLNDYFAGSLDTANNSLNIGVDIRSLDELENIRVSIEMAKYKMLKRVLECKPSSSSIDNIVKQFIQKFREIMNLLIEKNFDNKYASEILDISQFLDTLIVDFSRKV